MKKGRELTTSGTAPWPKVRLGDVGTLIRGKGIKRSETCATGKPCIRYGEIYTSFNVLLDKPRSFVSDALFGDCPHIKKGDLVLTLTGENKEEIAKTLCYLGDEEIAAGGDLAIWSGHGCNPKYLAYLMYSPTMIKAKADASNGHIVVHASVKKLQDIELPLPPLAEQKKIVEKVEKALRRVDALKAQFERMEKSAADYFKAALAETFAAVKGEKVKLGDVCDVRDGTHDSPRPSLNGYPLVTSKNIKGGILSLEKTYLISEADYEAINKRSKVDVYDVLFSMIGTVGEVAVIREEPRFAIKNVGLIKTKGDAGLADFLFYYLKSEPCRRSFENQLKGSNQKFLALGLLREIEIPKDCLDRARQISSDLDAAKAKSERMVAAARRGIEICGKMRKAILAEAFQ